MRPISAASRVGKIWSWRVSTSGSRGGGMALMCGSTIWKSPSRWRFRKFGVMLRPGAEATNEGVEGGREQQAEHGDAEHSEEHGGAEGLPHLRAGAGRHGERKDTENEGEGSHQDRAKARPGGRSRGLFGRVALLVLPLPRELDGEDRVL